MWEAALDRLSAGILGAHSEGAEGREERGVTHLFRSTQKTWLGCGRA